MPFSDRAACLLLAALCCSPLAAEDELFSGPQAGEKLPALPVKTIGIGDDGVTVSAEPVDLIEKAEGKPLLVIFFHKLTRPGYGLARTLTEYVAKQQGVSSAIVFLDDDPTEREQWLKRGAYKSMPRGGDIGIAVDGADGPGAYGLNRNVTLTVLVGKAGKTTANFALVQPSVQADALKIAKAVAAAAGIDPPTEEQLTANQRAMQMVRPLLGALLKRDATAEEVDAAAAKIEQRAARQPALKRAIGQSAARVLAGDRPVSEAAAKHLKKWTAWGKMTARGRDDADAPKRDAPKRGDAKRDAPKRGDAKRDAPKRDAPKRDAPKRDAPKRGDAKREVKR